MAEIPSPPDEVPDVIGDFERNAERSAGRGFDGEHFLMNGYSITLLLDLQSQAIKRKLVQMIDIHTDLAVNALRRLVDHIMRESDVIQPRVIVHNSEDLLPDSD